MYIYVLYIYIQQKNCISIGLYKNICSTIGLDLSITGWVYKL